jgi:hypothetical protein
MKEYNPKENSFVVEEPSEVYMNQFSSQEEAERYNMIQDIERPDMEKFRLFCKMLRIGRMLSSAKVVK